MNFILVITAFISVFSYASDEQRELNVSIQEIKCDPAITATGVELLIAYAEATLPEWQALEIAVAAYEEAQAALPQTADMEKAYADHKKALNAYWDADVKLQQLKLGVDNLNFYGWGEAIDNLSEVEIYNQARVEYEKAKAAYEKAEQTLSKESKALEQARADYEEACKALPEKEAYDQAEVTYNKAHESLPERQVLEVAQANYDQIIEVLPEKIAYDQAYADYEEATESLSPNILDMLDDVGEGLVAQNQRDENQRLINLSFYEEFLESAPGIEPFITLKEVFPKFKAFYQAEEAYSNAIAIFPEKVALEQAEEAYINNSFFLSNGKEWEELDQARAEHEEACKALPEKKTLDQAQAAYETAKESLPATQYLNQTEENLREIQITLEAHVVAVEEQLLTPANFQDDEEEFEIAFRKIEEGYKEAKDAMDHADVTLNQAQATYEEVRARLPEGQKLVKAQATYEEAKVKLPEGETLKAFMDANTVCRSDIMKNYEERQSQLQSLGQSFSGLQQETTVSEDIDKGFL